MLCPAAYGLTLALDTGVRHSTVYSAEGTLAHSIAEACLMSGHEVNNFIGRTMHSDGFNFKVDEHFADAVGVYVNFVRALRAMGYAIRLETQVSPTRLWPDKPPLPIDLFGTSDCRAIAPDLSRVVIPDLKFGRGEIVEAAENTQLKYYAAGSIEDDWPDDMGVDLVIVQPRAYHEQGPIRVASYTVGEIRAWARDELYPAVERAVKDNGQTFAPSDGACRWCPAKPHCKAQQQFANDTARMAFANAPLDNDPAADLSASSASRDALPTAHLSDAQLGQLVDRIHVVMPWMQSLLDLAEARLATGATVPGWKLVPKQARRAWARADEQDTIDELVAAGVARDKIVSETLLSPAQVERNLGKDNFAALASSLITRNSSGHKLVPETDPRARLRGRTAREAFGFEAPQQEP